MKKLDIESMIGKRYGEHNQVEIISGEFVNKIPEYKVICHICKEDPDLFGDGVYRILHSGIARGAVPCGCSKTKWSSSQYATLIQRKCATLDYEFLGVVGDGEITSQSRLNLRCLKHLYQWDTTSVYNFVRDGFQGCHKCKLEIQSESHKIADDDMIESFRTRGALHKDTTYWRSPKRNGTGHTAYWYYTCPICSNDEFVQNGLCSGVFESLSGSIQQGGVACRCSDAYRFTDEQREYQINKRIQSENLPYSFIRLLPLERNRRKFEYECSLHGITTVGVNDFLNGTKCASCAKSGYDKTKEGTLYVLEVVGTSGGFTGYGISNKVPVRLAQHKSHLKKVGMEIVNKETFTASGIEVQSIEKAIKESFAVNPQMIEGFKTEATYLHLYTNVVDFVQRRIADGTPKTAG